MAVAKSGAIIYKPPVAVGPVPPKGGMTTEPPGGFKPTKSAHQMHTAHVNHVNRMKNNAAKVRRQEALVNKYTTKKPSKQDMSAIQKAAAQRKKDGASGSIGGPVTKPPTYGFKPPTVKKPTASFNV